MNFSPQINRIAFHEAATGSFCMLPGTDGAVLFGMIVQSDRPGRVSNFLDFSTFTVVSGSLGFDTVNSFPEAFIRTAEPLSNTIRSARNGHIPGVGSIVFGSDGPAILASSGHGPESVLVTLDLRSGIYVDRQLHRAVFCPRWNVLAADANGCEQILLEVQAEAES